MVRNTYIYPPEPSMRIISDIFAYTSREDAEVQLDLDLRLSHAGGRRDGGPGARLHAGRRRRVRARRRRRRPRHRRVRAAAVVLLGDRHELLHGDRQDARRPPAVGEAHQGRVQAQGRASRWRCARTARPAAGASPPRTCSTTSRAPASRRWRPRTAARSRCTPTRSTRRSRCRPTSPPASPATRSSSSSRRPAPAASSIRGAAATTSSG